MDYNKSIVCEEIDKYTEELFHLSNKIWKYAEPGGKEIKSVATVTKFLKKHGFEVTLKFRGIATAFKAEYSVRSSSPYYKKPNVAFVCRYDAINKHGHLRGNNLVTEVAVGAALGIRAAIERSCPSAGKVTVIGCPNSLKGGVIPMVNRLAFKDVDAVLMAIPAPRTEWSPVYLGRKIFRAVFKEGQIPCQTDTLRPEGLDGAMTAYQSLMTIQEHFGKNWKATVSVGGKVEMRTVENRYTSNGHMQMCLKAPSNGDMYLMEQRINPVFEGAAHALSCDLEMAITHKTYYSLISNKQLCYLLQLNAYLCGTLATPLKAKCIMQPQDMGNVSHVVPTIRPFFYIGQDAEVGTQDFKAAVRSDLAQVYTIAMAKALAMTAMDILNSPSTLASVKADLQNSLTEEKNTTFKPFPVSTLPGYRLVTAIPRDSNVGWSKQA